MNEKHGAIDFLFFNAIANYFTELRKEFFPILSIFYSTIFNENPITFQRLCGVIIRAPLRRDLTIIRILDTEQIIVSYIIRIETVSNVAENVNSISSFHTCREVYPANAVLFIAASDIREFRNLVESEGWSEDFDFAVKREHDSAPVVKIYIHACVSVCVYIKLTR